MSPFARVEVDVFAEIAQIFRDWAEALEQHASQVQAPIGPQWSAEDLTDLYETWLRVGYAIRDLARHAPEESPTHVRDEINRIRDGLRSIAELLQRQNPA